MLLKAARSIMDLVTAETIWILPCRFLLMRIFVNGSGKMVNVCRAIRDQKEDQSNSAVKKAMLYIQENYSRDISLDDVSREVDISPYYFSKLFKQETR